MKTREESAEDLRRIMAGEEPVPPERSANAVGQLPPKFGEWVKVNKEQIEHSYKSGKAPYFLRDNFKDEAAVASGGRWVKEAEKPVADVNPTAIPAPKPQPTLLEKNNGDIAEALGVRQGAPMSFDEANEMRGNPNYKKSVKYRVNCQCSVLANELRRRGYDVEAFGNTKEDWFMPSVLAKKPEIAFIDATGKPPSVVGVKVNGDLMTSLRGEMKDTGRYHIRFRFQNDGGHVITAERLADGSLRIYDPQSGKIIKDFSEYTTAVKHNSFEYYRVDDLRINPDVAKGAVKLAKSKGDAPRMQLPVIKDFLEKGWYGEIKADVADYVRSRKTAMTYRDKVALDLDIVKNGKFVKSEYHSTAKGSIFATEELPKKIDKTNLELSKNIQMARKMANNGYDVYLLSNPQSIKSADFLLSKNGKVYYTEGKLSTGKNSLDHNLTKGGSQSECILIDLTGTNDTNYISSHLKDAFKKNSALKEVMLLKGGRLVSISELTVQRKDFYQYFKKIWEQKK